MPLSRPVFMVLETTDGQLVNIAINNNAAYGYDVRGELVGEAGSIAMNCFTSPGAEAPFGGYRDSGIGREGGPEMYQSYTVAKTIAERRVQGAGQVVALALEVEAVAVQVEPIH